MLSSIASGTSVQCQNVVDKGGIPLFLDILQFKDEKSIGKVLSALNTICSYSIFLRDNIIKQGGIGKIVEVVQGAPEDAHETTKKGCQVLSNLCKGSPFPRYNNIQQAILVLCQFVVRSEKILSK